MERPDRGASNKVCYYWQAGRCNRHPCPFLHAELPSPQQHSAASTKRSLVWRNPNSACGTSGPPSTWGRKEGRAIGRTPCKVPDEICKNFLAGNCTYGKKCRFLHSWFISDSFSFLAPLPGHEKGISSIILPSGSNKLYSGSKDASIRVWDCRTGQCVGAIDMGGQVGCMINEGPWIFIGIPNTVKAWNTQTSTYLSLEGPVGQVYSLIIVNEFLFAGTQDGRILAWKFNAAETCFEPAASLFGHRLPMLSLLVVATRLFSTSMDHTIRVWDLTTLQSVQTLTDHTSVVMSVLCWDKFLLSCSLDKTIKVWVATETGNLEVKYTHNEEHGVLSLFGMHDAQGKPVLLCSCNDNIVRLYELPSFNERGKIFSKEEVRTIQAGPDGLFFTGDATGDLKVWKWLSNDSQSSS